MSFLVLMSVVFPLVFVNKEFSEDVSAHIVSWTDVHRKVFVLESFGYPCHTDTVCSTDVSHCRVFASTHDLGSSLVILEEFCG